MATSVSRSFLRSRDVALYVKGREGGERFVLRPRYSRHFKMAEKTDKADSVSQNKYLSNQTLFPILGSQSKSVEASRGLIFPCASSDVEKQSADVDKGKLYWSTLSLFGVKVIAI